METFKQKRESGRLHLLNRYSTFLTETRANNIFDRSKINQQMILVGLILLILITVVVYISMFNPRKSASDSVGDGNPMMPREIVAASLENQAKAMTIEVTKDSVDQILIFYK